MDTDFRNNIPQIQHIIPSHHRENYPSGFWPRNRKPKLTRLDEITSEAIKRKADIILIQETKIKEEEEAKIAYLEITKEFTITSNGSIRSPHNNIRGSEGLLTAVKKDLAIHNIYAPNEYNKYKVFIINLENRLNEVKRTYGKEKVINVIIGDFNAVIEETDNVSYSNPKETPNHSPPNE